MRPEPVLVTSKGQKSRIKRCKSRTRGFKLWKRGVKSQIGGFNFTIFEFVSFRIWGFEWRISSKMTSQGVLKASKY